MNSPALFFRNDETPQHDVDTEISGFKPETTLEESVETFLKKNEFQWKERFGILEKGDAKYELLANIQERLMQHTDIPPGQMIVIDSPDINAFVMRTKSDVYAYVGLLRAFAEWCKKNERQFTADKLAFIMAHEMTHIEQGTSEDPSVKTKKERSLQDIKNNEYDADRGGLILMAEAGYNPREGLEAIEFLQSLSDGIAIASTHPRSSDRLRELLELVESPDTFLPNIEKSPEEITGELYTGILEEPSSRPGTKLYRKEGIGQLDTMMKHTDNFYDAVEIAAMANEYDSMAVSFEIKETPSAKKEQAKRVVIENVSELINGIVQAYGNSRLSNNHGGARESGRVHEITRFRDQEFSPDDFSGIEIPNSLLRTASNENEQRTDTSLKELKKKLNGGQDDLKKELQKIEQRLTNKKFGYSETEEECIEKKQNLVIALEKLNELSEKISSLFDGISDRTIDELIQNTTLDENHRHNWSDLPSSTTFITNHSLDELLEWCKTDGSIFFQNYHSSSLSTKKRIEKSSGGLIRFESSYEPELASEYRTEDISTPEGRAICLARHRLATAELITSSIKETHFHEVGKILSGEPIGEIQGQEIPKHFGETIKKSFAEKLIKRYSPFCSSETSALLSQFMSENILFLFSNGYNPSELQKLLDAIPQEELLSFVEHLPLPSVELSCSAGQKFQSETSLALKIRQFDLFTSLWEEEFKRGALKKLDQMGVQTPSTETRLLHLQTILAVSSGEAPVLYQQEILALIEQSTLKSFDDLQKYVSPFLNLEDDKRSRNNFLDLILKKFDGDIPPRDILLFLKGEEPEKIWEYFHTVWKEDRRSVLAPQEQLELLQTLFSILPRWSVDCLQNKHNIPWDERDEKLILFTTNLTAEYITLYRELNPKSSFVEIIRNIPPQAIIGIVETPTETSNYEKLFLGKQDLHQEFKSLSIEETKEIILLWKHKETATKIRAGVDETIENKLLRACIEKVLDSFYATHGDYRSLSVEDRSKLFKKSIDYIVSFVPPKFRDQYITECLQKICSLGGYSIGSEFLEKLDELESADVIHLFRPIPEEAFQDSNSRLDFIPFEGLEAAAKEYDPSLPGIDSITKSEIKHGSERLRYIDSYLHLYKDKRRILREKGLSPLQKIDAIQKLIPERTNYKDFLLREVEEDILEEMNLTSEGHRVISKEQSPLSKEQAQTLYYFYLRSIPEMVNTSNQQLWSRRADQLWQEFLLPKEGTDFSSEFERIQSLYPDASYARDEALMQLGDSPLIKTPEQAKKILDHLFVVQRRSVTKKEMQQQGHIEKINPLIDSMSRDEKKDFLLWTIGATTEPPLTFRAFGGHNKCSVEEIPKFIFAVTPAERKELFIRLLSGTTGILNSENGGEKLVESFLEEMFEKIFPPSESLNEQTRTILLVTFQSIMKNYSEYRKANILISMIEVLKEKDPAASSLGERIHTLLGELGPVAIKLEQVLSEEEKSPGVFLLPEEIRTSMKKSKQDAKTFHRTAAFQVLESAREFEAQNPHRIVSLEKQLAAASIKQVALGRREDGTLVIEKIRRPSIGKHLEEDLKVLQSVLQELAPHAEIPEGLGERISRWIQEEADFDHEIQNHLMIQAALEQYPQSRSINFMPIRTAEIYTSDKDHIQEEWIQGLSLEEIMVLNQDPSLIDKIATKHNLSADEQKTFLELSTKLDDIKIQAFDVMIYMMFKRGEFHSDLHGGNIIITPKGEMAIIDAGSAGKVEVENLPALKKFFMGFLFKNPEFVEEGIRAFVPQLEDAQIFTVMDIIQDVGQETKEQFKQILQTISLGNKHIDKGFEKFLKGLATGAYLSRGIDQTTLAGPTMKHASLFQ